MPSASPQDYVELRARSAFSFLEASAQPEDLAERAAELDYPVLALADHHGVSGAPRFHKHCRALGLRGLAGAEISLERPGGGAHDDLLLLVESPLGWRRLCRLITAGQAARPKGECLVGWDDLAEHAGHWSVLVRGDARLRPELLERLKPIFGDDPERLWVDVSRPLDRETERMSRRAADMASTHGVPVVATGDVRCARAEDRPLLDALTCLRWGTSLDGAGRRLLPNGEQYLHARQDVVRRFADHPEWIHATRRIADRCEFTLEHLGYRFPRFPLAPGETQQGRLEWLAWEGARTRYGQRLPARVRSQIEHELRVIGRLDLAGYFLIVHDIALFARQSKILCQGRGSAANSAVCYALGITAVDPVGMELLFERFLSEERGEWPDIDLDLPSGDQRERVIQYVFEKYASGGSAMTANVITYRLKPRTRWDSFAIACGASASTMRPPACRSGSTSCSGCRACRGTSGSTRAAW
jgi:error-prone DNA polymerase